MEALKKQNYQSASQNLLQELAARKLINSVPKHHGLFLREILEVVL